jgi:hypothetical protein
MAILSSLLCWLVACKQATNPDSSSHGAIPQPSSRPISKVKVLVNRAPTGKAKVKPQPSYPVEPESSRTWHLLSSSAVKPYDQPYISPIAQRIRESWRVPLNMSMLSSPIYQQLRFDEAIDLIYQHQNPSSCKEQYYMLASSYDTGFASEFHISSHGLALAMEVDRVYLASRWHDPKRAWQVPPMLCGDRANTLACYFEPWSNCTLSDVDASAPRSPHPPGAGHRHKAMARSVNGKSPTILSDARVHNSTDRLVSLHLSARPAHQHLIPKQLRHLVDSLPIPPNFHYYWWRAVATAYLSRLRAETQATIQMLRIHSATTMKGNCVSVYVRHGDKEREMKLHSFAEYAAAILNITKTSASFSASPTLLLGTETPAVYEEVKRWARDHGWRLLFNQVQLDVFLARAAHAKHSLSNLTTVILATNRSAAGHYGGHVIYEYPAMIAYLADLMSCDRFVCTLASNYCRMLDELRVFVTGKVNAPFVDLSPETCIYPPCGITPSLARDFHSFNW